MGNFDGVHHPSFSGHDVAVITGQAMHTQDELRQLQRRLATAALLFGALLAAGVLGYRVMVPDTGLVDALYMTVITLTTVGFGEVVDLAGHPGGRIFTMVLLLSGLGIALYFATTVTALLVEGHLGQVFWRRRMEKQASRLRGHHIVCGSGETAVHAARELSDVGREVVLICDRPDHLDWLRGRLEDIPILAGDPGEDEMLRSAGIEHAEGLLVATENDKENVIITLTGRQANERVRIVARTTDMGMTAKLYNVGADAVVAPSFIGGMRLASELIRPTVVSFLDQMLRDREKNLRVGEVHVPESSALAGKRIGEVDFHAMSSALLLACRCSDGQWVYNPPSDMELVAGVTLILMGSPADLDRVKAAVEPAGSTPAAGVAVAQEAGVSQE